MTGSQFAGYYTGYFKMSWFGDTLTLYDKLYRVQGCGPVPG